MPDPRFYRAEGPFPLIRIAEACGGVLHAAADPGRLIRDVAPLDSAGAGDVSFLDNKKYVPAFRASAAGACLVHPQHAEQAPAGMALVLTATPYHGYARVARLFYPETVRLAGISPRAAIDPTARLGEDVAVGDFAVIGSGAEIGPRCRIAPHAVIGPGVRLGADCSVGAHASIVFCLAGDRLRVYAGARIGEDGFGYALDRDVHVKIPQLGRVVIGDDVEIGANATIDRGAGPDTVIGDGCKIDNLVQIGHNVRLGRGCILVAQTGISGSTRLGNYVVVGGQGGLAGHLTIGDGARIGPQSGVAKDIPAGATMMGSPAVPVADHLRQYHVLRKLVRKKEQ